MTLIYTAQIISVNLNWPQTRLKSLKRRLWNFIKHTGEVQWLENSFVHGSMKAAGGIMGLSRIFPTSVVWVWFHAAPVFMAATLAVKCEFSATEKIS